MRTTLNLDDGLMRQIKQRARASGKTMTEVIEEILRDTLVGERPARTTFKLHWITQSGELRSGVDLDDRDAMYEIMEGRE